jgi:hypothetical protein
MIVREDRGSEFRRLISIMLHGRAVRDPAAQRGYILAKLWQNLVHAHFDFARRAAKRRQITDIPKD